MAAGLTYTPLITFTPSSLATTATISSIPSTYTDLVLVCSYATTGVQTYVYFNGVNSGTAYSSTLYEASNGGLTSAKNGLAASIWLSATNAIYDATIINIPKYSSTGTNKSILWRTVGWLRSASGVGSWGSTAAINSITLLTGGVQTFPLTSQFTLYGITAA